MLLWSGINLSRLTHPKTLSPSRLVLVRAYIRQKERQTLKASTRFHSQSKIRKYTMATTASWAVKENRPAVTICTLSMIIIGILMIFAGGLMTYIYFTEITPPNYDAYYQRYVGSSFPRIFGVLILMVGLILFWGASIFLVYANWRESSAPRQGRYYFDRTVPPVTTTTMRRYNDQEQPSRTPIKENYIG